MVRYAINFDGDGLDSIAVREASRWRSLSKRREGTLGERFGGGGIDRLKYKHTRRVKL